MAFSYVLEVPAFPDVPVAPGIPPMNRPTAAIAAVLGGPNGLNALLSDPDQVEDILGNITGASLLIANIPGAQTLLAASPTAQSLLYSVPGLSTVLDEVSTAQSLLSTVPGLSTLLGNVPDVQDATSGEPGTTDQSSLPDQPWGLFDQDNNPVVIADSVIKLEFVKDWKVSDYPVEQGTFQSYNKVETPYIVRAVLAKGGDPEIVGTFLSDLQSAAQQAADLYNFSSPQWVYSGVTIDHLDWSQEATKGARLLQVAVWMQEIRERAAATVTGNSTSSTPTASATPAPQSPSGTPPVSGGSVQAQPPTTTQSAVLAATTTT